MPLLAQDSNGSINAHQWRAQMMRLLADGGLCLQDATDAGDNEAKRALAECRQNYARKLRERFLGSAAQFLLHDQDLNGIEKLEGTLTEIMDDSLRFSCKLWSRVTPVRFLGWKQLQDPRFKPSSNFMTVARTHSSSRVAEQQNDKPQNRGPDSPLGYHDDYPVIMVLRPAMEVLSLDLETNSGTASKNDNPLILLKAQVMLATTKLSASEPMPTTGAEIHPTPLPETNSTMSPRSTNSSPATPRAEILIALPTLSAASNMGQNI